MGCRKRGDERAKHGKSFQCLFQMRMRFSTLLITILTATFTLLCQNLGGSVVNGQSLADKPAVQLSTSIIEERYCRDGGESLRIRLRLRSHNAGHHKVILYKESRLIVGSLISRNAAAARKRRYLQTIRPEIRFPSDSEVFKEDKPDEAFIILRSGAAFLTETEVDIPVRDKSDPHSGLLPPGHYVLQIQVSTWLQSPEPATALRRRWRKF